MNRLVLFFVVILGAIVAAVGWKLLQQDDGSSAKRKKKTDGVVPVEVAVVEQRSLQNIRAFSGSLRANAEFVIAPKISGRVKAIHVDLADPVERGMLVAEIDQEEPRSRVLQAEAEVEVAKANHAEAKNLLEIAKRELQRIESLNKTGVTTASQRDAAYADHLAKAALVNVTRAKLSQVDAALETARIQLRDTQIRAEWHSGSDVRYVARRYLDEGEMLSANTALLRIVELDTLKAVFRVTDRDYGLLQSGQAVRLSTDALAKQTFAGRIARIAPVFDENTRQADVEVVVQNSDLRLKPGMFVRAEVILQQQDSAQVVPQSAVIRRDDQTGLFVLDENTGQVDWQIVEAGILQGDLLQVTGIDLNGRKVVVLGQHMLKSGSAVKVVEGVSRR